LTVIRSQISCCVKVLRMWGLTIHPLSIIGLLTMILITRIWNSFLLVILRSWLLGEVLSVLIVILGPTSEIRIARHLVLVWYFVSYMGRSWLILLSNIRAWFYHFGLMWMRSDHCLRRQISRIVPFLEPRIAQYISCWRSYVGVNCKDSFNEIDSFVTQWG
jgi:hypothetical protein